MEQNELYLERKKELFDRAADRGYMTLTSLKLLIRRFKLSEEEVRALWDEVESSPFEVLSDYQAKARELPTKEDRIIYCYYVFLSKLKANSVDVRTYSKSKTKRLISTVNDVLSHLNGLEKQVIETYYGLKDGVLLEDDEKTMKAVGAQSLDQYIDVRTSAFAKLKKSSLVPIVRITDDNNMIANYKVTEVSSGSKDCMLFAPYNEEGKQICGPAILQTKGEERSTDIGYIKSPGQLGYSFSLYNSQGDDSCLIFYNDDKKARPEIYFCKDYISIGIYYPKLGYHSNLYTFKRNEKVRIDAYWEGRNLNTTSIDVKMGNFPVIEFPFAEIKEGEVSKKVDENYRLFVSEEKEDKSVACKIENDGTVYLGEYSNACLNGLVVRMFNDDRIAVQRYKNDEKDDSFVLYANTKFQFFEFRFKNEDGTSTKIFFDPNDGQHTLIVANIDSEGKKIDEKIISNPLFDNGPIAKPASTTEDGKTCEQRLNELIGLDNVKKMIKRLKALLIKNKDEKVKPNLNMFFTGNPGTGKTEVARLLAGILYDNGIVKENKFIEVDRSGLVGRYVGESEKNTDQIIKQALGGVLFIDEAYSLYTGWEDKDYGNQVLDKLVKAMEDHRGEICIIFAGYKDDMDKLYTMNQGLASRINRKIDFPNYTLDELKLIAEKFLRDNGYTISEEGMKEVLDIVETRINNEDFGNARDVRNILEAVYEIQAERTEDEFSNRNIELGDLLVYEDEQHIIKNKKGNVSDYKVPLDELLAVAREVRNFTFDERFVEEASVNIKILDKANGNVVSEGSGFFINADGLIGTCAHVIKDAEAITVVVNIFTSKGKKITKKYNAEIVGFDDHADVGLIKIVNPDLDFTYYQLATSDYDPALLTEVVMGGYPLGGERFEKISVNEGKVQSINKDTRLGDEKDIDRIYVDLTGVPGNSGSGVIEKNTGKCVAVYAGASIGRQSGISHTLNFGIHLKYLWDLMQKYSAENK